MVKQGGPANKNGPLRCQHKDPLHTFAQFRRYCPWVGCRLPPRFGLGCDRPRLCRSRTSPRWRRGFYQRIRFLTHATRSRNRETGKRMRRRTFERGKRHGFDDEDCISSKKLYAIHTKAV
nr:MAG TPA: hypothetical protein [Caudoviricetes sp.]